MAETPKPTELTKVGISLPYASQILGGTRTPPRNLAIKIFRELGWRHSVINELSEADMATFERIEPWEPRRQPQDEAA